MNSNQFFAIACLVIVVPFIILGIRMAMSQHRYLSLYKQAHPGIQLPEGTDDPMTFVRQLGHIGNGVNAYFEVQDDPRLEEVRQEVTKRMRLTFIWGFGCPILFFIIATIFQL